MIKRIEKPEDFPPIFLIRDDIEQHIDYDRSSWIQWLVENCKNPLIGIFADIDSDDDNTEASGYAVVLNSIAPPFSRSVVIMYIFAKDSAYMLIIEAIKEWALSIGASRVEMQVEDASLHEEYGFVKKSSVVSIEV